MSGHFGNGVSEFQTFLMPDLKLGNGEVHILTLVITAALYDNIKRDFITIFCAIQHTTLISD